MPKAQGQSSAMILNGELDDLVAVTICSVTDQQCFVGGPTNRFMPFSPCCARVKLSERC